MDAGRLRPGRVTRPTVTRTRDAPGSPVHVGYVPGTKSEPPLRASATGRPTLAHASAAIPVTGRASPV